MKQFTTKRGNTLEKHVRLFSEFAGLDPTPFQDDLDKFKDLITLRNCITHCWGKIDEARNPREIREAMRRLNALEKEGNYQLAEVSQDGYILLGADLIPHSICLAECIVDSLFIAILNASIT